MTATTRARVIAPVSMEEINHAIGVIVNKYPHPHISSLTLETCANHMEIFLSAGRDFDSALPEVYRKCLSEVQAASPNFKRMCGDGLRIIFAKRHTFATQYARAQGWSPPPSPFKRPVVTRAHKRHTFRKH